ncbi:hypothetical protein C2G38_2245547 [Gigaspora rosea]|uniref:Uncharacterized protein n=1 Tax=Gigaspora rosea TaxID=44941 RepID=A0A397V8Q6_9GLOM|nr:hypothetical protein C2G38_2245547 [Gigaspora rosea]
MAEELYYWWFINGKGFTSQDGGYDLFTVHDMTHRGILSSSTPVDVDEEFFLRPLKNYSGVDVQAGMSITRHHTIEAYNMYRAIAKLVVHLAERRFVSPATLEEIDQNNETDKVNEEIDQNNNEVNDEMVNLLIRSRLSFTPLSTNEDIQDFSFKGLNLKISIAESKI